VVKTDRLPVLRQKCDTKSRQLLWSLLLQVFTRCSTSGFLPARAGLVTIRCEAVGTIFVRSSQLTGITGSTFCSIDTLSDPQYIVAAFGAQSASSWPPDERESGANPELPRSGKQERRSSIALAAKLGSDGR
jgi:hypothetical protein